MVIGSVIATACLRTGSHLTQNALSVPTRPGETGRPAHGDDGMRRAPVSQRCYSLAMVTKIISGCQTGADQAGVAVAKRLRIPTGGLSVRAFSPRVGRGLPL